MFITACCSREVGSRFRSFLSNSPGFYSVHVVSASYMGFHCVFLISDIKISNLFVSVLHSRH